MDQTTINRCPPGLAFWRELHHADERRSWRCRPTPIGVQVQFRDEGEDEWSGRTLAFKPPPEDHSSAPYVVASPLGSFTSHAASPHHQRDRRFEAAAAEALALVTEQLPEGFVDISRNEGEQYWELCAELWRFESNDVALVNTLLERVGRVPDEARRALGQALTRCVCGPWSSSWLAPDRGVVPPMCAWWPIAPSDREIDDARRALSETRKEHGFLLLCAMRVGLGELYYHVMNALKRVGTDDEALSYALIYDLLIHPSCTYSLGGAVYEFTRTLEPNAARVAAITAFARDAPTSTNARSAADERHFQRGHNALEILAGWARNDAAADALLASPRLEAPSLFRIAARERPDPRWLSALRRQRSRADEAARASYDAAIEACERAASGLRPTE